MSTQYPPYQDQPPPYYQEPPKKSGSGCGWGILIGCLGTVVVGVLLCAGGVWYVQQNFDKWIVGFGREAIVAVIEGSEIPQGEKQEVIVQVDRVVAAYKAREINQADLERIFEQVSQSPAFMLIPLWGVEQQYLEPSGLTAEEKAQGKLAIQRAFRGVLEKKIEEGAFQQALPQDFQFEEDLAMPAEDADAPDAPEAADMPEEPAELESKPITDEDVKQMIAGLKKLADDAGIPDEPFQIDIGDEIKKAVDRALADKGADK